MFILDFLLYGAYSLDAIKDLKINHVPVLELARTPFAINIGILGAVLVRLLPQEKIRAGLTLLGLACIAIATGLVFTALLVAAILIVWFTARALHSWSARRGKPGLPLLVGWLIVNTLYFPLFFMTLPAFDGFMSWGELVLFWGPAFAVFKSIHFIHQSCKGRIDPYEQGAFGQFLLYMVHFASFWFGPYQKFRQFSAEVATCKERLTLKNQLEGWKRIGIGVAKFLIIFHVFNVPFFYKFGYFGPFSDTLFANAATAEPGHLWLMMYLFAFRITLFISALSDGVIGMNLLMGIRVPENSNWPLFSPNILEFWRRWHIQANVFLRDEVFFAAGGRRSRRLGFFVVFAYSGFWHFPSPTAFLAFPLMQLAVFEATFAWDAFWKRHAERGDWIAAAGRRFRLHDSWLSGIAGMLFVTHVNILSIVFIHDHFFGGYNILPRMFGF